MATDTLTLSLEPRSTIGKKVKSLRKQGIVPVAVTGKNVEPYAAQVDEREFLAVIKKAGYTGLIELQVPGKKKQQAFLQEIQRHSVSARILHADFKVVDMNKPVEVDVPVVAVGENELVERGNALVNVMSSTLKIRALPSDIPHQIEVDISTLDSIEAQLLVKDLKLAGNVEIIAEADQALVTLSRPQVAASDAEGDAEGDAEATASDEAAEASADEAAE